MFDNKFVFIVLVFMFQNTANWPLIAPLASYGRGRERPGGRYISFIHGEGLHDVIITGKLMHALLSSNSVLHF